MRERALVNGLVGNLIAIREVKLVGNAAAVLTAFRLDGATADPTDGRLREPVWGFSLGTDAAGERAPHALLARGGQRAERRPDASV